MRRKVKASTWASEAAMCDVAMEAFRAAGWAVYAETFDYDMILVAPDGTRYGIEAKLKPNLKVLCQVLQHHDEAIHYKAVLVPEHNGEYEYICRRLKVACLVLAPDDYASRLPWELESGCRRFPKYDKPLAPLPSVCVVQRAGVPAPRQITKWKLKAVRFCLDHKDSLIITQGDLKKAGLSPALWVKSKWLERCRQDDAVGKRSVLLYKLADHPGRPDLKYPEIADAMRLNDAAKAA